MPEPKMCEFCGNAPAAKDRNLCWRCLAATEEMIRVLRHDFFAKSLRRRRS